MPLFARAKSFWHWQKCCFHFIVFLSFTILYHLDNRFVNSGDDMSMLLLMYLSFANTFSYFVLYKRKPLSPSKEKVYNLISNLVAYSIMINLCACRILWQAYFKSMDYYWQRGLGIYYFINDDRYSIFAAEQKHVALPFALSYIINYGTILLELAFPFLVWYKRPRNVVFAICLLMHIGIYCFLMIYGMTIIFIIQYGLFYTNEEVMAVAERIRLFFKKRFTPAAEGSFLKFP
jgi:hypothetical protein